MSGPLGTYPATNLAREFNAKGDHRKAIFSKDGRRLIVVLNPNDAVLRFRGGDHSVKLDEMVMSYKIFTDLALAKHAAKLDIESMCGTSDIAKACEFIITHGEIKNA